VAPDMLEYTTGRRPQRSFARRHQRRALCRRRYRRRSRAFRCFGENIGWAFQVTDDILDVEESSAALGKTAGKDVAQQRATYPAIYGLARSHEIANDLAIAAITELAPYADRAARSRHRRIPRACAAPDGRASS